jgi:hypothetical protein
VPTNPNCGQFGSKKMRSEGVLLSYFRPTFLDGLYFEA